MKHLLHYNTIGSLETDYKDNLLPLNWVSLVNGEAVYPSYFKVEEAGEFVCMTMILKDDDGWENVELKSVEYTSLPFTYSSEIVGQDEEGHDLIELKGLLIKSPQPNPIGSKIIYRDLNYHPDKLAATFAAKSVLEIIKVKNDPSADLFPEEFQDWYLMSLQDTTIEGVEFYYPITATPSANKFLSLFVSYGADSEGEDVEDYDGISGYICHPSEMFGAKREEWFFDEDFIGNDREKFFQDINDHVPGKTLVNGPSIIILTEEQRQKVTSILVKSGEGEAEYEPDTQEFQSLETFWSKSILSILGIDPDDINTNLVYFAFNDDSYYKIVYDGVEYEFYIPYIHP